MHLSKETATVSFIKDGYAFLETGGVESACGKCSARFSCSSMALVSKSSSHLKIKNSTDLKAGDAVSLGLATDKLLFGTMLMYLLPLLVLFIFAAAGKYFGGELVSSIAGISGLFISLMWVKKFLSQKRVIKSFTPTIVSEVDNSMD